MTQPPTDGPFGGPPPNPAYPPGPPNPAYPPGPPAHPYAPPPPTPPALVSPLPVAPADYQQMLRTPRQRWWKGLLMIVSFVAAYLIVSLVLQLGAIGIDVARGRVATADLLGGKLTLTPTLLLSVNLTNAAAIPISMLLQRAFFGQRRRWLHSVVGTFRWRLLGRAALIVVPIWAIYLAFTLIVSPERPVRPSGEAIVLLVIVVLTTPFQAAGEEYGARGLIARGAGSWMSGRTGALVVSTLVSSVVFMLAHGAGDPWLIAFYFFFGVMLSLVTWRTGGLEVAVLLHATNNLIAFGSGIILGEDLSSALDRSNGTGSPAVLIPAAALVLSVAGVWLWAQRSKVVRAFTPEPQPVLAPPLPTPGWSGPPPQAPPSA